MSSDPFIAQDDAPRRDLSEFLDLLTTVINGKMHTGLVARVKAFDASTRTATVTPVIKQRYVNGDREEIQPLPRVPVGYPGGGGFLMSFPLQAGDHVFVSFSERSIDEWKAHGNKGIEPQSLRRFDLSDGVIVATLEAPGATSPVSGDNMIVGEASVAGAKVTFYGNGKLTIGTTAAELLAILDGTITQLQTLNTAVSAFSGALSGAVDPVVTAAAATLTGALTPITAALAALKSQLSTIKGP